MRNKISWRSSRREVEEVTLAKLVDQPTGGLRASTKLVTKLLMVQLSKKLLKNSGSSSKRTRKATPITSVWSVKMHQE
jgi:hypothetical protein